MRVPGLRRGFDTHAGIAMQQHCFLKKYREKTIFKASVSQGIDVVTMNFNAIIQSIAACSVIGAAHATQLDARVINRIR